jgi:hypothetical protein
VRWIKLCLKLRYSLEIAHDSDGMLPRELEGRWLRVTCWRTSPCLQSQEMRLVIKMNFLSSRPALLRKWWALTRLSSRNIKDGRLHNVKGAPELSLTAAGQ